MSTYGRNFEFRVQPHGGDRSGRFINPSDGSDIPIGAPVAVDTASGLDSDGRLEIALKDGAVAPVTGMHGIVVKEYAAWAFNGDDEVLTTYSDKDLVKAGDPCYLVSGTYVKVLLRNTNTNDFFGQHTYTARTMVAEAGGAATPNVSIGDYLTPQTSPSGSAGYWVKGTSTNGWLVVTSVDVDRGEVEARFTF